MFKPKPCLACGNNPTAHLFAWLDHTLTIVTAPASIWLASSFLYPFFSRISEWIFRAFLVLFRLVGALTVNENPERAASLRGKVLWEEARRRGIPMRSFLVWGRPVDVYETTVGGRRIYFNGLPRPVKTKNKSEWWMDDKFVLKEKLAEAGLPIAAGGVFSRYEPLLLKFRELSRSVIVKPRLGSRGRHTTTHITNETELKKAFDSAKKLCYWVIMEEHLVGSVYRATVIDGALAGVLRGDPPRVTGDGKNTIAGLIDAKNKTRPTGVHELYLSDAHRAFLSRLNLSLTDILPQGTTIDLLEKIGVSYGGSSAEVTDITHPETKRILEAVAAVVDDPLMGFDFIIEHIDRSPHEQTWGVIECNGLPFINLHHFPIEGTPNNVARRVWDYAEAHVWDL